MRSKYAIFLSCLLVVVTLCAAQSANNSPINPAGKMRGKKSGNYNLQVVGQYSGKGAALITPFVVTISVDVKAPNGKTGSISFGNMPLVNDRFQGSTTFNGIKINISGRIDMPANTDKEQTSSQAITGRATAQLIDTAGKGGRLIAIEDPAYRFLVPSP